MSRYLVLLTLVAALSLTIMLGRSASSPTSAATPPASVSPAPASTPPVMQPRETNAAPQTAMKLPDSFKGTHIDGQFRLDQAGNLIVGAEIRQIFDYFLAAIGEESLKGSIERLHHHIAAELPEPAQGQAIAILNQYLSYKRQLLELEASYTRAPDLGALRQRLSAVQALRAQVLDPAVHQAFFALDEAYDRFSLERLAIRSDPALDSAAKGRAIDQLRASLPGELQDLLVPQLQTELREQSAALLANGGSAQQIRQLRQQLVGSAAAERLEALDQQRHQWQQRVAAYRQERQRIETTRGLDDIERLRAIERLETEHFDESERLRLVAAYQQQAARTATR
ncbi:lipase chaperone [Stutzerimonas stutzeri]|uniref:Lipase chaperone n=1 Tax=Stutzerimonas stutzeri TaxID=316 RepID=A0A2S4ATB8_STUST|nr:lipase secretion chaperone [Stutzerimonas stutzeri]MCQ4261418.1 lipase secretion chaperone [Stutzerimonas stutzeri]POH84726.1 lipase chaperone [Stutzerimonas stutzeri]